MRDEISDGELRTYYRTMSDQQLLIYFSVYAHRPSPEPGATTERERRRSIIAAVLRQRGVKYHITDGQAITCLTCGRTSHNPNDVAHRYCGHCHVFHDDPDGARR